MMQVIKAHLGHFAMYKMTEYKLWVKNRGFLLKILIYLTHKRVRTAFSTYSISDMRGWTSSTHTVSS